MNTNGITGVNSAGAKRLIRWILLIAITVFLVYLGSYLKCRSLYEEIGDEPIGYVTVYNERTLTGIFLHTVHAPLWMLDYLITGRRTEIKKPPPKLPDWDTLGDRWELAADVIVETADAPLGSVRIIKPALPQYSNTWVRLQDLESALQNARHSLAIVRITEAPAALEIATNTVNQLRQCGFGSVHVITERLGRKVLGPDM